MLDLDMPAAEVIRQLRALGLTLWVSDGVVHGKMRNGGKIPFDARPLIDHLQTVNDEAARIIESENVVSLKGIPASDLVEQYGPRYHAGEIVLVGKMEFHLQTELCDATFREVAPSEG